MLKMPLAVAVASIQSVEFIGMDAPAQREKALQQYETMTCHLCGEPMKKYIAHYPHQAHVRCLLKKLENSKQALCCC
jgi:hypothetical protein